MPPGILSLYICIANLVVAYTLFICFLTVNNCPWPQSSVPQEKEFPIIPINSYSYVKRNE